jgi:hypothetical protein
VMEPFRSLLWFWLKALTCCVNAAFTGISVPLRKRSKRTSWKGG